MQDVLPFFIPIIALSIPLAGVIFFGLPASSGPAAKPSSRPSERKWESFAASWASFRSGWTLPNGC